MLKWWKEKLVGLYIIFNYASGGRSNIGRPIK
jgi:hypothetical protein